VYVWFSGGKGLTRVWSEAGILNFSFHSQKVHWDAIFLIVAYIKLQIKHTLR